MMYGTVTMRELRKGMNARRAAQKKADQLSWKAAIRERIVTIMTLWSILAVTSLTALPVTFA